MKKKDYYAILEMDMDASQADVKKAYRTLARKFHPDMNPGDKSAETKFKEIKEAYEVLSNPLERDKYDREYESIKAQASSKPPPPPRPAPPGESFDVDEVDGEPQKDIFSEDAKAQYPPGQSSQPGAQSQAGGYSSDPRRAPKDGIDLRYDLEISFEDMAFGLETEIQLQQDITCNVCFGQGAQPGTQVDMCGYCQGTGKVNVEQRTEFGITMTPVACQNCFGKGKIIRVPCQQCNGMGTYTIVNPVYIKVPPGVEDAARLRIKGKGEPGINGGKDGDLYIIIHVKEHQIFERHGNEVLCETTITYTQAVMGAEIDIPTLEGTAKMKIPEGTQTGTVFRLRGKGIMDPNTGARGDQHVKVTVVTPKNLNEKQKKLLLNFAQAIGEDTRFLKK